VSLRHATAILRREPALKLLPWAVLSALVLTGLVARMLLRLREPLGAGLPTAAAPGPREADPQWILAILFAAATAGGALVGWSRGMPVPRRVKSHERALPVTQRSVVLQRALVSWLLWCVPLLASTLLLGWMLDRAGLTADLPLLFLVAGACVSVAALAPFCIRPRRPTLGPVASAASLALSMLALLLPPAALLAEPERLPSVALLPALGLAPALFLWLLWRLPAASPAEDPRVRSLASGEARAGRRGERVGPGGAHGASPLRR